MSLLRAVVVHVLYHNKTNCDLITTLWRLQL